MNIKIKNILKKLLVCSLVFFSCLPTQSVSAWWWEASRSMWITLYDEENYEIAYTFYDDQTDGLRDIGKKLCYQYKGSSEYVCNFSQDESGFVGHYSLDVPTDGKTLNTDLNGVNALSFPRAAIDNNKIPNTSKDYNQGQKVLGALTSSLNSAMSYVVSNTGTDLSVKDLAEALATAAYNGSGTIAGKILVESGSASTNTKANTSIQKTLDQLNVDGSWAQGITKDDFIVLSVVGDSSTAAIPLIWRAPTGYGSEQALESTKVEGQDYLSSDKISWVLLVTVASTAYDSTVGDKYTVDGGGFEKLQEKGVLESALSELASKIVKALSVDLLGFYSLESMVLNRGTRGQTYYLGLMPYSWFQASNKIFWISQIIAVFVLLASVIYTVFKQNYAIISPKERINLQDRIQNLLISILLLILYVPIFYVLAKFNSSVIEMLDTLVTGIDMDFTYNLNWILSLLIAVVQLGLLIKINVDYLVRAVMITVLHAIAPVAISTVALSENGTRGWFNVWLRELFSTIYMQAFDAVILVLFMLISKNAGSNRWWEIALMVYMFIPLNKWFKEKFIGDSVGRVGGDTFNAAAKDAEKVGNFVKNTADGTIGAASDIRESKQEAAQKILNERGNASKSQENRIDQVFEKSGKTMGAAGGAGGDSKDKASTETNDKGHDITLPDNPTENTSENPGIHFVETKTTNASEAKDGRAGKTKLSGGDIVIAMGAGALGAMGLNGAARAVKRSATSKYETHGKGTGTSSSFESYDGDAFENDGSIKQHIDRHSVDARTYINDSLDEEYKQNMLDQTNKAYEDFRDVQDEEELMRVWNEKYKDDYNQNAEISDANGERFLEQNLKDCQTLEEKKEKLTAMTGTQKANKIMDKAHPNTKYKMDNIEKQIISNSNRNNS